MGVLGAGRTSARPGPAPSATGPTLRGVLGDGSLIALSVRAVLGLEHCWCMSWSLINVVLLGRLCREAVCPRPLRDKGCAGSGAGLLHGAAGQLESGNAFNCEGSRWLFHRHLFQRRVGFCCWLLQGNGSNEGQKELVELESQSCRPWAGSLLREAFQNLGLASVGTAGFCSTAHWEGLMV